MEAENYWQLGRWAKIPVAMHWTALIMVPWLYILLGSLLATAIASLGYFFVLAVHEAGHVAVLKWRKIAVEDIAFYGLHGKTRHEYAGNKDEILIAWGGVAAQTILLALALAYSYFSEPRLQSLSWFTGPLIFMFVRINFFLILIALLPIGPFDGRNAWRAFPYMRERLRARKKRKQELAAYISPERQLELEDISEKATADLMEKLGKKKMKDFFTSRAGANLALSR